MTQRIYWYTTAVIAAKFGIQLHAVQVLSTHIHEVLTDVNGNLPAFLRERNRLLANALKCHRGWPEEVFQRAPASCVELYGPEAVAKEIGYTLANCVEAGLVNDPAEWPGVTVLVDDIGHHTVEVDRPNVYFDPDNRAWPRRATIAITMPDVLLDAYGSNALAVLRRVVHVAIERARSLAREAGRHTSWTAAKLCSVPFTRRSRSFEPFGQRDPTFATAGKPERAREAIEDRRNFRTAYRRALDALKAGIRGIAFPPGAWRWVHELLPSQFGRPRPMSVWSLLRDQAGAFGDAAGG